MSLKDTTVIKVHLKLINDKTYNKQHKIFFLMHSINLSSYVRNEKQASVVLIANKPKIYHN